MIKKNQIILFVCVLFIYLNSINNPFIFDDYHLVIHNTFIKNFKFFKKYFTTNLFEGCGEKGVLFYRPIQTLSYSLIYKLFRLNPVGYHLLNIFLHSGCAILIYLLLKKIYQEKISFLVSLLWAIHPINSEAITYISGTADPLFLFFGLVAIYLYNLNKFYLSLVCFILSLLSKETGLLILPLFFLYQHTQKKLNKNQLPKYITITLIFLIYLLLRKTILNFGKSEVEEIFLYRFYTSFKAFLVYISILLFPFILSIERHLPYIKTAKDIDFIFGFIFLILFLYFLWLKRKEEKIIFAGILFLVNFLFHSNTIIPLNGNLREHWMYLGSIGFFIYFVLLIEKINKEKLKLILTILIFLLYGTRTILRNYDWNNEVKFYEKTLKYFPDAKRIIHNYGVTLMMNGKYREALSEFKKLEKILSNRKELSKATLGIGKCYFMLGNYEESLKYYNKTIELDPLNFDALTGIALIYEKKGDIEKSLDYLIKAYKINPNSPPTLYLIGKIYFDKKQYLLAEKIFIKLIEIEPNESIYWNKLGIIYYNKKEFDKSLYCFENAYKFNNKDFNITLNLAKNYQKINQHNHAIFYFDKTFQINPETKENIYILNDYAISLNEIGEKQKAIEILKKILKKNPDFQPAKINLKAITSK